MAEKKIKLAPIHPGEILREDFMVPLGFRSTLWLELFAFHPTIFPAL